MIRFDCEQGSEEWIRARLGIPTASQFHRIITPKTRKLAAGSEAYLNELLAEWLVGIPASPDSQGFLRRGTNLEGWAVSYYELQRELTTEKVGLVMSDDRMVAASPDRLVGPDGGLEIKCPSAAVHVANLLHGTDDHLAQIQGCLWISGRSWWDLLSYHPEIPPYIVRVQRDEDYIRALEAAVGEFTTRLLAGRERLRELGCTPAGRVALPASAMAEDPF